MLETLLEVSRTTKFQADDSEGCASLLITANFQFYTYLLLCFVTSHEYAFPLDKPYAGTNTIQPISTAK